MLKLIPITTPLRKFEGHEKCVRAVAVFPDKQRMVMSSDDTTLRLWDQPIKAHSSWIDSLDFSLDGTVLATGSGDNTTKLWNTKTWELLGDPIKCGSYVRCVRYSPSGELLAIATDSNIQIYNPGTRERVPSFKDHTSRNSRLTWTPDGSRLLTVGDKVDPTIREWDTLTWQQVGVPWTGHTDHILDIAVNPTGTLAASASDDKNVRLWRLSDRQTVAIFNHSSKTACVIFSVDGKHILSGGTDHEISEWAVPKGIHAKILAITTARDACIHGDLSTAEELLTQDIDADANNHTSYAHRSFVMARKHDWVHALEDAIKSISIQPSLTGYISKGIALCGKGHIRDARAAFDVAFMYTNQDSGTIHFLLLIKAIALFNADQHDEAMLLLKELAAGCPDADTLGCRVVQAYLFIQLGIKVLGDARHEEAADHFTAAVSLGPFSSKWLIHETYEELVVLFGLDLKSLWLTAHQKRCQALLSAGKHEDALKSHETMMDAIDKTTKASCLDWSTEFQRQCNALAAAGDRILGAEIPGQDQGGYDAESDFFRGHSQISRPRPQQRPGRLKKLRLAVTRTLRSAPTPAPPTTVPPATAPTTFKAQLRHLFTWRSDHAGPPVVEVPFAQGLQRNAAAGAPTQDDDDLVRDEDFPLSLIPDAPIPDTPNASTLIPNTPNPNAPIPNTPNADPQQQSTAVQTNAGDHGGGRSCFCC